MARYAYLDYIDDIKAEKSFYRHLTKQSINRIGKQLEALPDSLMAVSSQNIRYMNILSDNIEEQFEKEEEELHRALYISFRNAKMQHLDCLAALHYISTMLQIASVTFSQCCHDMKQTLHKDPTDLFSVYNLNNLSNRWSEIVDKATECFGYNKNDKKTPSVDLNNLRCIKAVDVIRAKLADIETLRTAMRKSYPWSINYQEGVPYEKSTDWLIVHSKSTNS
jgi:hypothetical protein